MSDLLIALILLGAFIIAAVVLYNMWQERKLRKEITSGFIVPQRDILADDFSLDTDAYVVDKDIAELSSKHEEYYHKEAQAKKIAANPNVREPQPFVDAHLSEEHGLSEQYEAQASEYANEIEPIKVAVTVSEASTVHIAQTLHSTQNVLPEDTHAQIHLTAILYATHLIKASDLSSICTDMAEMTSLPLMLHGLNDELKWQTFDALAGKVEAFKQIACSIQLADRGGPISRPALNKFQFLVEDLGLNLNAHVEWQGNGDAMLQATELDQFCMEVDQLINIHVGQSDAPIHGTKFKGLAEANNLSLGKDGKFQMFAKNSQALQFTIIDTNQQPFTTENLRSNVIKSLTFQLEIPKVAHCEASFNEMIAVARQIATSLNAHLIDDHQKTLGDLQIEKIRQQLRVIHAKMVARSIMPGSPSALRLFS